MTAKNKTWQKTKKQFKDTLFRTLFKEKARAAELCNALLGTNYTENEISYCDESDIVAKFNDLAFEAGGELLVIGEAQSTQNENMPLRMLEYLSTVLQIRAKDGDLYARKRVMIPTPKLFVLYNGENDWNVQTLKLSDAFIKKDSELSVEITVKVINIKIGHDAPEVKKSGSLQGYSYLINKIHQGRVEK
jgi:hypothetical protein